MPLNPLRDCKRGIQKGCNSSMVKGGVLPSIQVTKKYGRTHWANPFGGIDLIMEKRKCNKCKEKKPLSDFGKDHQYSDGLTKRCRKCMNGEKRHLREVLKKKKELVRFI